IYSAKDATLPHAGVQLLKGAAQYYAIDNDPFIAGNPFGIYDGFTDAEKFLTLSSGFTKTQAGDPTNGNDVSHVVASGPHDIPAGEEITLAFALHGASSSAALITSSQYADSVYNYTLNAPKPAGVDVEVCHGNDASINATGATKFKWYKDFTGGSPLASGSPLNLPDLIQDTTVYVSNAEHTYESLRVPVHVKVNPNPVAAFTFSGDLLSGEPVSFTDQSTGATAWSWNFGDAATSTAQNPQHAFDLGGNFLVSLQVTSNKGCQHTTTKSIAIITGTERNVPGGAEVYPNPISNGEVSIKIKDQFYGDARVIMVNAQGQTIRVFAITSRTSQSIDVSDLAEGVYVLKIVLPHRTIVRKMIVQ
ncbi:MAG: PKD domain-containing protein, partial [Bacteroidota bacterium]